MKFCGLIALLAGCWFSSASQAQTLTSSNLPIFKITTNGTYIVDEPKRMVGLEVIDNGPGKRNNLTDAPNGYNGKIGIEYRGSSSQTFPKKPYGFETWDSTGNSVNIGLMGFPAESDWILNANYNDKTMIRNFLVYSLASRMGRYASRTRFCEVVLDDQYQGVYLFQEKIKRDKNRVNISNLKPTDNSGDALTGGYIVKIDKTTGSPAKSWYSPFLPDGRSKIAPLFLVEYPKIEDITDTQFNYIKNFIIGFETALYSSDYLDTQKGFRKYIDEDSFVDYFILTELAKPVDGYRLSTFMYKDKDSKGGKLNMGPAWDYDIALGNGNYYDAFKPSGWQYQVNQLMPVPSTQEDPFKAPAWWTRLLTDIEFSKKIKTRWQDLRKGAFQTDKIIAIVDSAATNLNEAQVRNFQRWNILGQYVWPNYFVGKSYLEEVNWLKDWIRQRLAWLDEQYQNFGVITGTNFFSARQVHLSPNPSDGSLLLDFELAQSSYLTVQVLDVTGRVVSILTNQFYEQGPHQISALLGELPSGTYIVNYQATNQPPIQKKWIKL
ncbi:MAG: CotH kinase family protein [Spirosomataceae bacterium]